MQQGLLVAQLGRRGQQQVLQVALSQARGQQRWGLPQMLGCRQAGGHGQWGAPGGAAHGQGPWDSSEGWHLGTAPQPCCAPHQTLPYLSLGEGSSEGGGRRRGMRSISCEIMYCVMPSCHESPVVEGVMRYWGGGGGYSVLEVIPVPPRASRVPPCPSPVPKTSLLPVVPLYDAAQPTAVPPQPSPCAMRCRRTSCRRCSTGEVT